MNAEVTTDERRRPDERCRGCGQDDPQHDPRPLDRLSWSPFHTRMVAGLGAAWILDGLQITIASSVTGVLDPARHARHDLDARSG